MFFLFESLVFDLYDHFDCENRLEMVLFYYLLVAFCSKGKSKCALLPVVFCIYRVIQANSYIKIANREFVFSVCELVVQKTAGF